VKVAVPPTELDALTGCVEMVGAVAAGGGGVGFEVGGLVVPDGGPLSLLPPQATNIIAASKPTSRPDHLMFIVVGSNPALRPGRIADALGHRAAI
jgi:hypothetical protein